MAFAALFVLWRLVAPDSFWFAFTPVFRAADAAAARTHAFFGAFENAAKLATDNDAFAKDNSALQVENALLKQKIADLSALISGPSAERVSGKSLLAGIVARPPENPYDSLVLDAGALDGAASGQEVFGAGGVPLGVVSSVLPHFSRVTLFSAPGVRTSAWIGAAKTAVTLSGTGGGTVSTVISRAANISVGETVYVAGPGLLPYATVVRIDGDASSPNATVRIQPLANPFSASWVLLRDTGVALLAPVCSAAAQP